MGYYTDFNLEVIGGHHEILAEIIESDEDTFYGLDKDGNSYDRVKWYDHEVDMKKVSKEYPELVFKLSGEGEEAGDLWIKYFKNGRMQYCPAKITYDDYDETKLAGQ
jgi:hypothetical protein